MSSATNMRSVTKWFRRSWRRLLASTGLQSHEQEMRDELASHIEMAADHYQRNGMNPDQARRAAAMEFGGMESVKESCREQRSLAWLENFFRDLRFAARKLRSSPTSTLVIILTLGIGIGANAAVYSLVNQILFHPQGIDDPGRVVAIHTRYGKLNLTGIGVSAPTFADTRDSREVFEHAAISTSANASYQHEDQPLRIAVGAVTSEWFNVFGATPFLGRTFTAEEDQPNANRKVVLSYATWVDLFGGDPQVIGRTVELNQEPVEIIGVMPEDFHWPQRAEVWMPLGLPAARFTDDNRMNENYFAVARLRSGVTFSKANAYMGLLADRYRNSESERAVYARTGLWDLYAEPIADQAAGNTKPALITLWVAVGLVLLMVCTNVAGMILARAAGHAHELSLRTALGASRSRLILQTFAECLLLGLGGGTAGVAFGWAGTALLLSLAPNGAQFGLISRPDLNVLLFAGGITLLTVLVFGLVPAWQLSHADPQSAIQSGTARSGSGTQERKQLRSALVVAETAVALILLVAAGVVIQSFVHLETVHPGFTAEGVMLASVARPQTPSAAATQINFEHAVLEQLRSSPGVTAAAIGTPIPFSGGSASASFSIDGRTLQPGDPGPHGDVRYVTPAYFQALQIPLLRGRTFTDQDREGAPLVTVIDENLAGQYWPDEDPLGQKIQQGDRQQWYTVIGVVGHVTHSDLGADTGKGVYYFSRYQSPVPFGTIVARTSGNPATLSAAIREAVRTADPYQPISNLQTMSASIAGSLAPRAFLMKLLGFFAGIALLLAALGLYGLISYSVAQRTVEIGIRMALGAERGSVLKLVVGQGLKLAALGVALGVIGAIFTGRLLESQLFEVRGFDPATVVAMTAALLLVAVLASLVPAQRVLRMNPVAALRHE